MLNIKSWMLASALVAVSGAAMAQDAGTLRVAIDPTYKPFTFKTPDGKPTGFDVDIASALCEQIKRKCVFVEQAWDSMIPGLQARKYDAIISSMSITPEREKVVAFTSKYYNTPSSIVVKLDSGIKNIPADLKGKRLGVLKGSTQEKYAMGELKPAGVVVVPYEAQDQVYLDIKSGRLDGTVADKVEVTGGFLSTPDGKGWGFVGPDLDAGKYFGKGVGVALRKQDTALRDQLNKAITTIRANGTWKKIADKYVNIDIWGA
ncbi:ABC transporter substrate-binding protein [Amphibiibacter pelophylacis]|uniref:ABC transporter substrate-binding protein n=1 Tax=Amphibiibacter pelophylacis TaxID=1799477 RepID=A0ACC6P087_9BURK